MGAAYAGRWRSSRLINSLSLSLSLLVLDVSQVPNVFGLIHIRGEQRARRPFKFLCVVASSSSTESIKCNRLIQR
jgi:hypothetical protein